MTSAVTSVSYQMTVLKLLSGISRTFILLPNSTLFAKQHLI